MSTTRLEAYSDAVIAIVITIMVLELRPPESAGLDGLAHLLPIFLAYVLSFVYLSIYWNNHHHLLHVAEVVNGRVLWTNIHLLFWLSLVPFTTAWLSEYPGERLPSALYGANLFMAGLAYFIMSRSLKALHKPDSKLNQLTGSAIKEYMSTGFYLLAIAVSLLGPVGIAYGIYAMVALIWVIPDRRFEAHDRDALSQTRNE
ncbi:MAG: DUF1211 domain-containing protein [Chloroflexi bacterium]|nr:TMEM175 family protein [Chloroflexota bacterium]MQC25964.1 DUF1211 domain-containing protein [Chloroflexota bacterium]